MPAKKKKSEKKTKAAPKKRAKKSTVASKIRGHGAAMKRAAEEKPGAYRTHKGGVVLNANDPWFPHALSRGFDSTEKALSKALSSKKAPQRGKQAYGNRKNKSPKVKRGK